MQHLRPIAAATATVLSAALWTAWYVLSRRLTPAQREERRRLELAAHGRIVDGILLDAQPTQQAPTIILYTYRVAGVTYECAQNIAPLPPRPLHPVSIRIDAPIQVRYAPANPANSIVLAETWNGLW